MEICVNDDSKIVEIWLSNSEKSDTQLRESLKPMYADYKKRKYTVAVFESGAGDLSEGTTGLLMQNRVQQNMV